jgi:anti-sigma regulatory factor (Ser/Thr protein kinase)
VHEASLTFPAELQSVGAARRFLRDTLREWNNDDYDYAAPLVVTELATNATLHARTPYTVLLRLEPTHLVVEVLDSSPRLPQARHYATDSATGRGITLVDSFSNTWGTTPTPTGKVVWAHVRPDDPTAFAVPDFADTGDAKGTGRLSVPMQQRGESNVHKAKADEAAA